jgi:hypothetical protein
MSLLILSDSGLHAARSLVTEDHFFGIRGDDEHSENRNSTFWVCESIQSLQVQYFFADHRHHYKYRAKTRIH